jgi:hypothetical protein
LFHYADHIFNFLQFLRSFSSGKLVAIRPGLAGNQISAAKLQEMLKPPAEPKTQAPPSRPLSAYAGLFNNELYGNFTVVQDGKNLLIKAGPAGYPGKLRHQAYDTFILTWPHINAGNQEVTFAIGSSGKAESLITETLGDFKRVTKQ